MSKSFPAGEIIVFSKQDIITKKRAAPVRDRPGAKFG